MGGIETLYSSPIKLSKSTILSLRVSVQRLRRFTSLIWWQNTRWNNLIYLTT